MLVKNKVMWISLNKKLDKWEKRKTQYKVDPQPYKANKNTEIKLAVNGHFIMPVNTTHKLITFGYFLRVILMDALRKIINKSFKKNFDIFLMENIKSSQKKFFFLFP